MSTVATAATTAMSSSDSKDDRVVAASVKARARWKLLQQALLSSNSNTEDAAQHNYSKRSFPGYQMLESRIVSSDDDDDDNNNKIDEWIQKLQWIDTAAAALTTDGDGGAARIRSDIECSVLAIHALLQTTTTKTTQQQPRRNDNDSHSEIDLFMDTDPNILLQHIMGGVSTNTSSSSSWWNELPALHPIIRPDVESAAAAATRDDNDDMRAVWRLTFHLRSVETKPEPPSKDNMAPTATTNRQPQYCVREYRLPVAPAPTTTLSGTTTTTTDDNHGILPPPSILTRERIVSAHTKLSLQELVSHRSNNDANNNNRNGGGGGGGVDNTGNICVWDCALTLAWALQQQQQPKAKQQQQQQQQQPWVVLELGAGMAAMSAFSLAVTSKSPAIQIYVTDGHADCVQNNRVTVRLLQAAGRLLRHSSDNSANDNGSNNKVAIDCRQLLWTTDPSTSSRSRTDDDAISTRLLPAAADTTLIADCTHFQEYHAALFWTAVRHTSETRGQIWMCQPKRGNSLQRFLDLIRAVNCNNKVTNNSAPLLRVTEQHYAELDAKHQQFLQESSSSNNNNNHYDPNLHRPRILILTKERLETEEDRLCAIRHMQERDQDKGAATTPC